MALFPTESIKSSSNELLESKPLKRTSEAMNRRELLKWAIGGSVGLAIDELLDVSAVQAATKNMKLANVNEFTTSCNFCSCGCGMIAAVRDGQLIAMEGDYDHVVTKSYGVAYDSFAPDRGLPMGGVPKRSAFIIDREGVIQYAESSDNPRQLPNFEAIKAKLNELV